MPSSQILSNTTVIANFTNVFSFVCILDLFPVFQLKLQQQLIPRP